MSEIIQTGTKLRDIIRDIRSDEANVYRELRRICSMCQDYDPKTNECWWDERARDLWGIKAGETVPAQHVTLGQHHHAL